MALNFDVSTTVSTVALLVSVISFEVNRRAANAAERHGRMPVLIPELQRSPDDVGIVTIRNIGKGPALNIVFANASGELATVDAARIRLSRRKHRDCWSGYMHLQPIAAGAERRYQLDFETAVGFSYTDALGSRYTLLAAEYGTKVVGFAAMPHPPLNELDYPSPC